MKRLLPWRLPANKGLDLALAYAVWGFIMMPVHEAGHVLAAWLVGLPLGTITIDPLRWTGLHWLPGGEVYSWWQLTLWRAGGGLFVAVLMGLLWWRSRTSPTRWDLDDESVLAILGLGSLTYAVGETVSWANAPWLWWPGLLLGAVLYARPVWRWLQDDNGA